MMEKLINLKLVYDDDNLMTELEIDGLEEKPYGLANGLMMLEVASVLYENAIGMTEDDVDVIDTMRYRTRKADRIKKVSVKINGRSNEDNFVSCEHCNGYGVVTNLRAVGGSFIGYCVSCSKEREKLTGGHFIG